MYVLEKKIIGKERKGIFIRWLQQFLFGELVEMRSVQKRVPFAHLGNTSWNDPTSLFRLHQSTSVHNCAYWSVISVLCMFSLFSVFNLTPKRNCELFEVRAVSAFHTKYLETMYNKYQTTIQPRESPRLEWTKSWQRLPSKLQNHQHHKHQL